MRFLWIVPVDPQSTLRSAYHYQIGETRKTDSRRMLVNAKFNIEL